MVEKCEGEILDNFDRICKVGPSECGKPASPEKGHLVKKIAKQTQ